jgi:hypothetical protein
MGGRQSSIKLLAQNRPFLTKSSILIAYWPEPLFKFALVKLGQIP